MAAEFEPLVTYQPYTEAEMIRRAEFFRDELSRRRTIRTFSDRVPPRAVIEAALRTAGNAPSGANLQPWHFVAVADPAIKTTIRLAAEEEERAFYNGRAPREWLEALAPLGTDEHKPFLEVAPWLIAIFAERYGRLPDGRSVKNYYVPESVGIACGFLIAALHHAGLASLTHTPSPMNFLNDILGRPSNEKPYLLLVVGYPDENTQVPKIGKKPLSQLVTWK